MVSRALFEGITIDDDVKAVRLDPLEILTSLRFKRHDKEIGFATIYTSGNLYCHEAHLPLAVEWLVNNYKHRKTWQWMAHKTYRDEHNV